MHSRQARVKTPLGLRPMLAAADRLRTSARLGVLVGVMLVPALVATIGFTSTINAQIAFSASERGGLSVLQPVLHAMAQAGAGREGDLAAIEEAVEAAETITDRSTIVKAAEAVADAARASGSGAGRLALVEALGALVTEVGDHSNMILDPDLDSFYVMDSLVVLSPRAMTALAALGAPDPSADPSALMAARAVHAGALARAAQGLRSDVETAASATADPAVAGRLAGLLDLADELQAVSEQVTADLSSAPPPEGAAAWDAADAAIDSAVTAFDALLLTRIATLESRRLVVLGVTAAALVLALWFAMAVWWRTRADVGLTVLGVTAIAAGDLSDRTLPDGRDEIGDIGRSLAVARAALERSGRELEAARQEQDKMFKAHFAQQQYAEKQVRQRASGVVEETAHIVLTDLRDVMQEVDAVRGSAGTIDERVAETDAVSRTVIGHARQAERVADALGESLRQVAGMASLIAGVAAQTKLLALNATIEAARAGEAGHGFRVVAGEVKQLALATARSTDEITSTIGSLERDAAEMASTVSAMSSSISGVDESTAVLSDVASRQRTLVESLQVRVSQAMDRVESMTQLTEQLERRHSTRVPVSGQIELSGARGILTGALLDLGSGGLRCQCGAPLNAGEHVRATFPLGAAVVTAQAEVVHCRPTGSGGQYDIGLQFTEPDAAGTRPVQRYLEQVTGEAVRPV